VRLAEAAGVLRLDDLVVLGVQLDVVTHAPAEVHVALRQSPWGSRLSKEF
jgi:hypothetical protein